MYFRDRWMLPRACRDDTYKSWPRDDWAIWVEKENGRG
jgi:hypothetical protein